MTENLEANPQWPIPRHLIVMFAIYLVASLVCFGLAIKLHHQAFTPPVPARQASVLVFTQDRHAKVLLQANVNPKTPSRDTLSVIPQGQTQGPWLLVVQCPQIGTSAPSHSLLYSELVESTATPPSPVKIRTGSGQAKDLKLGCFAPGETGASIANVTLPALETDPAIATAPLPPKVFAGEASQADPISVLQIFAGCPLPTLGQGTPASTVTTSPVSPGCAGPAYSDPSLIQYFIPASMQTREVLTGVNLSGYQTESDFPVPQITGAKNSDERYTWNGLSSLSPSLLVSNVTRIQNINRWSFDAAVLYGVGAATGVGCIEKLWIIYVDWQKRPANARKASASRRRGLRAIRGGVLSAIRVRTQRPHATRYQSSESAPDQRTPSDL